MKLRNLFFLSRANLKGAKRKKSVFTMTVLTVVSIVLLAGFSEIFSNIIYAYKNDPDCRTLLIYPQELHYDPDTGELRSTNNMNESFKEEILKIDHVLSCEPAACTRMSQLPEISEIRDENGNDVTDALGDLTVEKIESGISEQCNDSELYIKAIKGEQLKDAPVMSCIIPDYGVPFRGKKFDTSALLGKIITFEYDYNFQSYSNKGKSGYINNSVEVPIKYDMKVVGIYHLAPEATGDPAFYVSPETALRIEKIAIESASKSQLAELKDYLNDPYSRLQYIKVDSIDNVEEVEAKILDLSLFASASRVLEPSLEMFVNFFTGAGTFLLGAILLLMVICLFLSVYTNINSRRSEIGLMKALGYKSSHIFIGMYIENVILSIRALIAGVAVSAGVSLIVNAINSSSENLIDQSYVMSFQVFGIMTLIAFAVILAVPLLCQLIMVKRLSNIRPQEAMNA